ncbi:MAG: 2-oxoglutarate dehydrogenase complex dihydrolipoyllysine-residue succinyltransferase [Nitrospirae bacterium]|nr:2-oxoglutarate dehydrogenase complex dihydrolipoyllysine-residue succinyltransferase [Nitrospirota bacterium]
MAVELKVPPIGESITEVQIGQWMKAEGDVVGRDETIVILESEKATVELPSPVSGILTRILKKTGEAAVIGEVIGMMEEAKGGKNTDTKTIRKEESPPAPTLPSRGAEQRVMPSARRALAQEGVDAGGMKGTGPGGRVLKTDVARQVETRRKEPPLPSPPIPPTPTVSADIPALTGGDGAAARSEWSTPMPDPIVRIALSPQPSPGLFREEEAVPMTLLRKKVAQRLVAAQQTTAHLTTFNEIDMSTVNALRQEHREAFQKKHGIKLGLMSFFVKAAIEALKQIPAINAEIRADSIVYKNYYDIGIAVGGGRGLVVPILRNAERMSLAGIETAIADFAKRAQENRLKLEELQGGTFTISNGGVYGSLLSTPILNPPQSGILGLHATQDRPVVRGGQIVIRPMMYVALTYDHRIVDGREAVTFLKHIKELMEEPARILLEL